MFGILGSIALKVAGWAMGGGIATVAGPLMDIYKAKLQAGSDHDKMAADLAAKEIELSMREAGLQAQLTQNERIGPRWFMGMGAAIYIVKVLVWDKALHLGVTDPLDPYMKGVLTTVIIAYCGSRVATDWIAAFRKK